MQHEERFIELMNNGDGLTTKREAKASIFTDVFGTPAYGLELLKALHPELSDYTEDDISTVTIRNILTNKSYNDLGILARDKFVILVEAQSTWSVNILIRILIYLAYTYKNYITAHELDVYSEKRVSLPKPEFYVIYTGKGERPEQLSFAKEFFPGEDPAVEITVKVLREGKAGDIIDQYMTFVRELDRNIQKYGYEPEAMRATYRYCVEHNALKEYLLTKGMEEVISLMMLLFDDETVMRNHDAQIRRESRAEGRAEGESKMSALFSKLFSLGGTKDAEKAANDPEYREELYKELGIA